MRQATIREPFTLCGKGLHTGLMIRATVRPGGEDTGICFCRTDLEGQPTYVASARYVGGTSRGTVLEQGAWKVSTVEHLMAALYAMGVSNCLVEVDGPEVPILDGSARKWVDAVKQVGVVEQTRERDELVITDRVCFDNGKGSRMVIEPCEKYEVQVHVDYPSLVLNKQDAELWDLADFDREIASARTFCFLREIRPLLHLGLIKGGDLQNALVIYDKRMWQWTMNRLARKLGQEPIDASQLGYLSELNYVNEPARHKLLDVVGDMALSGRYIRGRIYVERPGHAFNTWCCKQLLMRVEA